MLVKFIYAENLADFESKKDTLLSSSVVFIEETKQIWTHGQYYSCPYSAEELKQLFGNKIDALEKIIRTDGDGSLFLTDDGEYRELDLSIYLKSSDAQSTYLTIEDAAAIYQEQGDYLTSIPIADGSNLGAVLSGGDVTISDGVIMVNDDSHNHTISNIDNLQDTLDDKVPISRTINGKNLSTNITLTASDVNADASGSAENALLEANNYTDNKLANLVGQAPEALDTIYELAEALEDNQELVNILNNAIGNKVDKEEGMGLSSNDFTDSDKAKLDSIKENAEENQNAFSNISVGTSIISATDKTDTFGLRAGKNIELTTSGKNITISGASYSVTNGDPDLSWGAKSVVGVVEDVSLTVTMPSNPNTHYNTGIRAGASSTIYNSTVNNPYIKVLDDNTYKSQIRLIGDGATTISSDDEGMVTIYSIKYENATTGTSGLMSAEDKIKLDGIQEGAQVNTVLGVKGNEEDSYRTGNVNITKANIGLGNVTNESKATMFNNPEFTGIPKAPTAAAGTNTTQIATTAFVQTEILNKIAAADALIYKGTIGTGGTITSLPTTHKTGWTYKVITAGTYAGVKCEVGDMIICLTDGTSASDAHWTVVQTNTDGVVVGPANAVADRVAIFNGTTGKLIKDSGYTIASSVPANAKFTDTTYSANNGVTLSGTTFSHSDTSTLNGNYGPTANVTGTEGQTIVVPQLTVDGYGHVTGVTNRTYTSKNTTYTFANGAGGFTVTPSGGSTQTVSIGKPSTAGTSDAVIVTNSDANNTYRMLFHSGNNIYSTAGVYCNPANDTLHATHFYETSDANLKTNIQLLNDSENMPIAKEFDFIKDGRHSYGFIAQELEEQGYDELVHTKEDGIKTVDYSAALSLAVAKMQKRILELEEKIIELERKLS